MATDTAAPATLPVDADVWIGGEPYNVLDDIKALEHVPCGAVIQGDGQRISHVCPPVCPECCDGGEQVRVVTYGGSRSWNCCGEQVRCPGCRATESLRYDDRVGAYCIHCSWSAS